VGAGATVGGEGAGGSLGVGIGLAVVAVVQVPSDSATAVLMRMGISKILAWSIMLTEICRLKSIGECSGAMLW
jgi:hypothetical protein